MRVRLIFTLVLAAPVACVWACGGSGDDSSGADGSTDGTTSGDGNGGHDGATADTGTTGDGSGGDTGTGNDGGTATDGSTSADGSVESGITCESPSDCTNGFCCGTIVFNGGTLPNCDLQSVSSACMTTCKSDVKLSCKTTDTVRGCTQHTDCTDAGTGYTDCCTVPFADASATFCWNATYKGLITGMSCN